MQLLSEKAIRDDIDTLNREIASLSTQRDALLRVLTVIAPDVQAPVKPKRRGRTGGRTTPYSCEELRDVVVTLDGEFTIKDLVALTGKSDSTLLRYLEKLIKRDIVTVRRATGTGRPRIFKYNTDIPPAPTSHPHEPTPESQAVGVTLANGVPQANGAVRVADTMIQGFINAAVKQGWTVTWKDGTHLKFANPDGRTVGVNSKPPSKQVGMVIKRDLKRSGLVLA